MIRRAYHQGYRMRDFRTSLVMSANAWDKNVGHHRPVGPRKIEIILRTCLQKDAQLVAIRE
jgi:hypothetical protein